jgi:hypothetical protein
MTISLIFLSCTFCLILIWAISPLLQQGTNEPSTKPGISYLIEAKNKLLEEFRDLEFDHQLNKMSYDDYQEQRKIVLQDLKTVYDKLDNLTPIDEQSKSPT